MEYEEEEQQQLSYKLRAEKSLGSVILLGKWSPRMDVIALALKDNSVVLYRLSWDCVWSIDMGDSPVSALSWRPDGKILSIGCSSGVVIEVSIEKGEQLQKLKLSETQVTYLLWVEAPPTATPTSLSGFHTKSNPSYIDHSVQFLPPLPLVESNDVNSDSEEDAEKESLPPNKYISHSSSMTLLIGGDMNGDIHFIIDGILHVTSLLSGSLKGPVVSMTMSHDMRTMTVITSGENAPLHYKLVDTSLLADKASELHFVAMKHHQVISVVEYIGDVIRAMTDSWEDSLLTVDKKMEEYAKTLPSCLQIMDEYLILLACGQARTELKTFLVDELTAKGVKKIGFSIEMSYKSLRSYTINHLNKAVEVLSFHLHDLLGVSKWINVFGCIGLSPATLQDCIQVLGSFALKAQEFLYITDESLQNLRIFFIWLYTIIVKLSGEAAPSSIEEGPTPEELQMIINFLRKRLKPVYVEGRGQTFSLDLVGQYLLPSDLSVIEDHHETVWDKIINDTTSLNKDVAPWLIDNQRSKSVIQLYHSLQSSISQAFNSIKDAMQPLIIQKSSLKLFDYNSSLEKSLITSYSTDDNSYVCIFPINAHQLGAMEHTQDGVIKCGSFFIQNVSGSEAEEGGEERHQILDMCVYNETTLSILFSAGSSSMVAQLPIATVTMATSQNLAGQEVLQDVIEISNGDDIGRELVQVTSLGRFQAKSIEVSGTRKLAAIVSSGGKRVQLYDVDAEQDEEDEDV